MILYDRVDFNLIIINCFSHYFAALSEREDSAAVTVWTVGHSTGEAAGSHKLWGKRIQCTQCAEYVAGICR